jgi:3-phosphoinositide dependent protein kinase-1
MTTLNVRVRDLKPENLLLDDNFRIKITDFGTGKVLETGGKALIMINVWGILTGFAVVKAETWVGTAQYVAPELLEAKETSKRQVFLPALVWQNLQPLSVARIFGLLDA